jgi:dolichol-phosphate mannosyltransferase
MTQLPPQTPEAVPACEKIILRPKKTLYCLCIPVLNEGPRIQRQLAALKPYSSLVDIIIADGESADGSLPPPLLKDNDVRALLIKRGPGRLGAQIRMALSYALAENYAGFIFMDGNDKDDPRALPLFAAALREGFDHVQGSRFIPGGEAVNNPWWRLWAVQKIHAPLIRRAAGFAYTDTTNGFRAYSRRFITDPRVLPFRDAFDGYELHYYLAIRAARLGFSVKEVPVTRRYPSDGTVPSKISPVAGSLKVMRALLKSVRGDFDPPDPAAQP